MQERSEPRSVRELCDAFVAWALEEYQTTTMDGRRQTGEAKALRQAVVALAAVAGDLPPADLRAEHLMEAQSWMVGRGLCRRLINARVNRIRRMVKWAIRPPRRWLSMAVLEDLRLVEPLRIGRTKAPEPKPVTAVSWEMVSSTIAEAPLELATMIEVQWWTGMRPCEVVGMRRSWLRTMPDGGMIYCPVEHKTAVHGKSRTIALGANAQGVLQPWLRRMPDRDRLWRCRTSNGYRQAVTRTNRNAGLPNWSPLQIRHSFATRVCEAAGEQVAQILLGHSSPTMTRRYIDAPDAADLRRAMDQFG